MRLHQAGDEFEEAAWVVERIARSRGRGGARPCCTARTRRAACSRRRCCARGIPYLVVGGVGFYERKEVKDVLAYLRLVQNPATTWRCGAC